jgi:hypothetical protein
MTEFEEYVRDSLDAIRLVQANQGAQLATLEERSKMKSGGLVRDGGLTISGGAVAAIIGFLAQHWKGAP